MWVILMTYVLPLQLVPLSNILTTLSMFLAASRIRYEITSGNIGGAFAVKNMTGAIYVAGALDYETRKRVSQRDQISDLIPSV